MVNLVQWMLHQIGNFDRLKSCLSEAMGTGLSSGLRPAGMIYTPDLLKAPHCLDTLLAPYLGDDPVFGRMNDIGLRRAHP
jgi:hypothetical protein